MIRGFFGIGIECCKTKTNYGTLFRTAYILGANFIFLIGKRFKKQCSDTVKSWRHIPTYDYKTFDEFYKHIPYNCKLVSIELDDNAIPIENFKHPERAIYLLGAEDNGLKKETISKCHHLIKLKGDYSLNVSVAGSIVLYHRIMKG